MARSYAKNSCRGSTAKLGHFGELCRLGSGAETTTRFTPMKSMSRNFIVGIFALAACCNSFGAEDKFLENEALGKLRLGTKAAEVTALLGKPEGKGKETEWDAIGEWVQEWRFKSQGLELNMSSASKAGAKTVLTITATAPSKLATARGIHIGSTIGE